MIICSSVHKTNYKNILKITSVFKYIIFNIQPLNFIIITYSVILEFYSELKIR